MRTLNVVLFLLLSLPSIAAAAPPEEEPKLTPEQKALSRLVDALQAKDARAAQQVYDQIGRDFKDKDVADESAWWLACFHLEEKRFDKAQDLLLSLKGSGRKNRWTCHAVIGLSEVAQKRGDDRLMLRYLEEATTLPPVPTGRNLMDTLDTRQEAFVRLARYYRDKGDFKKALDYYTRWEPESSCGTCLAFERWERQSGILSCRLRLRDYAGAVQDCFGQLRGLGLLNEFDANLLTHFYRQADQLDDLRRLLDEYKKAPEDPAFVGPLTPDEEEWRIRLNERRAESIQLVRDILHIETLGEKKDVAALLAICQEEGDSNRVEARRRAAAEALSKLDSIGAIQAALDKKPKEAGALIEALGLSNAPESLEALKRVVRQESGSDRNRIQSIINALECKGKAGREILRELADNKKSVLSEAADRRLALIAADESKEGRETSDSFAKKSATLRSEVSQAKPKAGSLPKSLEELRQVRGRKE
jgi:hypothetical protein